MQAERKWRSQWKRSILPGELPFLFVTECLLAEACQCLQIGCFRNMPVLANWYKLDGRIGLVGGVKYYDGYLHDPDSQLIELL